MQHRLTVAPRAAIASLTCVAAIALIAGCSGSDASSPSEAANVRIVNASVSAGPITANAEGRTIATNVAFQTSTLSGSCGTVEKGGDEQIDFVAAGTTSGLGNVKYNFVPQQSYTVVFYGANTATVYPDQFTTPSSGNNAIRFINATGTAGDVYLTSPSASITGSPTVGALAAGQASGFNSSTAPGGTFAQYPTGSTRVRLFNVGQTTGTPRADFTIPAMPSNGVATIILTPPPSGGSSTAFMVGTC
jgi:hypothetical protein